MQAAVTIVIPCYNEERYIRKCLQSVVSFEVPEGVDLEIVVVDGMSTDRTPEIVRELMATDSRISLLENPKRIQSCALNLAVKQGRGDLFLRLDAHASYPEDYLRLSYETALATGASNVGGVCLTFPGDTSYQARLVQALTTHRFGVGNSGFRVGASEGPRDTVPFGFFRREIFDLIGYFDERLVRTQDYEFNRRIIASGNRVWLNPKIQSSYFNQPTLYRFYSKQLLKQGPFMAYLWYLAPHAFALRHAATLVYAVSLLTGALLAFCSKAWASLFLVSAVLYGALAFASAIQQAVRYRDVRHALFLPPCFFLFHFLHGLGVMVGALRVLTGTTPFRTDTEPWAGAGTFRAWPRKA